MRAAVTDAPRSMQVRDDAPEPGPPGPGEVVVRPRAVGADARRDGLEPGATVALWPLSPCGACRPCRLGRGNVCERFTLIGIHTDGGLQERLTMPQGQVFPIAEERPVVAALTEPMSIAVRAVNSGRVADGEH